MAGREPQRGTNGHDDPPICAPAKVTLDQTFEVNNLYALRAAVAAHATDLGVPEARLGNLIVAATELATNAVRHGGGSGRLRLWRVDDSLCCEVSDEGPGIPDPEVGTRPVPLTADHGRGLWVVRQLCDGVRIDTSPAGTTIVITIAGLP